MNFDVLFAIMSFLEVDDLSRFMRTCHTLYDYGLPLLLGCRLGDNRNPLRAEAYYNFLLSDFPHRLRHLRSLYLSHSLLWSTNVTISNLISVALTVIQFSPNITYLEIHQAKEAFNLDSELLASIGQITSLRHLKLHRCDATTAESLFQRLRSPLHTIDISFPRADNVNPLAMLYPTRGTLQSLSVGDALILSSHPSVSYPQVHTLRLSGCSYNLQSLAQCMPRLRRLTFAPDYAQLSGIPDFGREHNLTADISRVWRSLDYVCGETYQLWKSGLNTNVLHVHVQHPPHSSQMLAVALASMKPPFVQVDTELQSRGEIRWLARAFPEQSWMERFELSIKLAPGEDLGLRMQVLIVCPVYRSPRSIAHFASCTGRDHRNGSQLSKIEGLVTQNCSADLRT